jgi:hypothetical protein
MTPKEKAEELIEKFGTYAVMWSGGIEVERQNVKQCALIAVDEIIKFGNQMGIREPMMYWHNVKQEIEKL